MKAAVEVLTKFTLRGGASAEGVCPLIVVPTNWEDQLRRYVLVSFIDKLVQKAPDAPHRFRSNHKLDI